MLFRRTASAKRREAELRELLLDGDAGRSRRAAAQELFGRALGEMADAFPFPQEHHGYDIVWREAEVRKQRRKDPRSEGAITSLAADAAVSGPSPAEKDGKAAASELDQKEGDEDSTGGIFATLRSFIATIFGARSQPAQDAKGTGSVPEDDKTAEVSASVEPSLEFPNPEEWLESARDAALRLPIVGAAASEPKSESADISAVAAVDAPEVSKPPAIGESSSSPPAAEPAAPAAKRTGKLDTVPPPTVPGLAKADLVVQVEIEPKERESVKGKEAGMAKLMAQSGGAILSTMASSGWKVEAVDASKGLFEISLPSVRYEIPGATVAIPSPRFLTTIRDSYQRTGEYEERLQGDLVLQNGKDILTVELGFPFRKTFAISAAGWTRSRVGWRGSTVICSNFIELGLQLPKVPGLASIMQYFVTSYGTESTQSCAFALAKGADEKADAAKLQIEAAMVEPLAEVVESEAKAKVEILQADAAKPHIENAVAEPQAEVKVEAFEADAARLHAEAAMAELQGEVVESGAEAEAGVTGQQLEAEEPPAQEQVETEEPDEGKTEPEWWESARNAMSESARGISGVLGTASLEMPTEEQQTLDGDAVEESGPEWWESARDAVSESARGLALLGPGGDEEAASTEEVEEAEEPVPEEVVDAPPPAVPGMDDANLVVHTQVERKTAQATETEAAGVTRLMSQPGGAILATMAQEGWKVEPVDGSTGLFEISLPQVRYELPGAVVSIPPPRFLTTVRDTFRKQGSYEERLQGDLVLQNGQDILTVELGFPFRTTFTVSAAGWCRAFVGWERDAIGISTDVEIGLQLPKFPGLEPIMKYFVKSYGTESTEQCALALARGADELPADAAEWLSSSLGAVVDGLNSVMEVLPELPSSEEHHQIDGQAATPSEPSG